MKAITWSTIAIAAAVITAAIFVYSVLSPNEVQKTDRVPRDNGGPVSDIFWIYVGAFTAIAVTLGLIDAFLNGYGDGDIF